MTYNTKLIEKTSDPFAFRASLGLHTGNAR